MMSSAYESASMKVPFMWHPYPDSFNFINKLSMCNVKNIAEMTPPCFTPLHKSKYCVVYDPHETRAFCLI